MTAPSTGDGPWLRVEATEGRNRVLAAGGRWVIAHATAIERELEKAVGDGAPVVFDLADLTALDTAGAWLLYRTQKRLAAADLDCDFRGARPEHAAMLDDVVANDQPCAIEPPYEQPVVAMVRRVGAATFRGLGRGRDFLAFLGETVVTFVRTAARPGRLRLTSVVHHMESVGLDALPIVGLISLLIGLVLGYQGATQLERFGAQIFVVDLVAVSVLREIGILLTAIVVAGRSGSAFTAQIGSMKLREEVDAMRTLGLDPLEMLVVPRALALILSLPLLALFADLMGLVGGGLMAWVSLGISPESFVERLGNVVKLSTFAVGLLKAPVFALLIALVGCYEGLQVGGSAESVGRQTTRAVVESIFLVIVADAAFSIFFNLVGV